MKYAVFWNSDAESDLAALWLAAGNRSAITAATAWLDHELTREPLKLGESRASSIHRIAFCAPIGIEYQVIADDQRVVVQAVFAI